MRLALVAVAALAIVAVACGGVESEPNLAKAAERTEAIGSFSLEMTTRFTDEGDELEMTCAGVVDSARRRARLVCSGDPEGESETITVDRTTYHRDPSTNGKWWKSPASDEDLPGEYSPDQILELLRSASRKTERVGDEEVRGEPTVRYALTVDCEQAELYECAGGTSMADVWIDDDGLVRRFAFEQGDSVTTSIDFFDFGQPVAVVAPPAGQVEAWPAPQAVPCAPGKAGPIGVGQASEALRRAGFEVRPDDTMCGEHLAAHLTNTDDAGPGYEVLASRDGFLLCDVHAKRELGAGTSWFTLRPSWVGAPTPLERSLENLYCTIYVEGPRANERIGALDAAFAELRRELGG